LFSPPAAFPKEAQTPLAWRRGGVPLLSSTAHSTNVAQAVSVPRCKQPTLAGPTAMRCLWRPLAPRRLKLPPLPVVPDWGPRLGARLSCSPSSCGFFLLMRCSQYLLNPFSCVLSLHAFTLLESSRLVPSSRSSVPTPCVRLAQSYRAVHRRRSGLSVAALQP
jgi:hypothetical protein